MLPFWQSSHPSHGLGQDGPSLLKINYPALHLSLQYVPAYRNPSWVEGSDRVDKYQYEHSAEPAERASFDIKAIWRDGRDDFVGPPAEAAIEGEERRVGDQSVQARCLNSGDCWAEGWTRPRKGEDRPPDGRNQNPWEQMMMRCWKNYPNKDTTFLMIINKCLKGGPIQREKMFLYAVFIKIGIYYLEYCFEHCQWWSNRTTTCRLLRINWCRIGPLSPTS